MALPPALTLVAQVIKGTLAGRFGVIGCDAAHGRGAGVRQGGLHEGPAGWRGRAGAIVTRWKPKVAHSLRGGAPPGRSFVYQSAQRVAASHSPDRRQGPRPLTHSKAMAQTTGFGCEPNGRDGSRTTSGEMPAELRRYLDATILEGGISNDFDTATQFQDYIKAVPSSNGGGNGDSRKKSK